MAPAKVHPMSPFRARLPSLDGTVVAAAPKTVYIERRPVQHKRGSGCNLQPERGFFLGPQRAGRAVLTSTVTRKVAAQMVGSRYSGSAPDRSVNQKRPPSLNDGKFSAIRRI